MLLVGWAALAGCGWRWSALAGWLAVCVALVCVCGDDARRAMSGMGLIVKVVFLHFLCWLAA